MILILMIMIMIMTILATVKITDIHLYPWLSTKSPSDLH